MATDNVLNFSLADFFYNDTPSIITPPADFEEWLHHPRVQETMKYFEQPLLEAPRTQGHILSGVDGQRRKIINLTSYNYLGLSSHPEVIRAAQEALQKYGLGASGAPMLSGTFDLHVEFANRLATFMQRESCLLFSSGLAGNLGAIQGIVRKGDLLILDERAHQSLIDGGTLAGAKMQFFTHNDIDSLAALLEKGAGRRMLVVVEGVYSMDGDLPKLPEIVEICEHYQAPIYIDEAHSTLLFGEHGRGVAEHFGLEEKIAISYSTLSKSFGGVGGFICASERLINYLKYYSVPWLFSCAPSPPIIGGLIASLDVATRDTTLRDRLWKNVDYLMGHLRSMGLNLGDTESHIIPIIIGSSGEKLMRMATAIQKRGLFLQPVDHPAVPAHLRRFRLSASAELTREQMDRALNIIEDVIVAELKND